MANVNSNIDASDINIKHYDPKSKHKNRRSLLLLLAVFILPLLLAKLALDNQWLAQGVTNQGKLLTQPLTTAELGIND